jgi:hypothetical protein
MILKFVEKNVCSRTSLLFDNDEDAADDEKSDTDKESETRLCRTFRVEPHRRTFFVDRIV